MTYTAGGPIEASDYNTFATAATGINEVFGDLHPGATTIAAGADFGYGQTPALTSVSVGANVLASSWSSLYTAMRNCSTHQGTVVVPPVPAAGPVINDVITAFNSPPMASAVSSLRANRLSLAPLQTSVISGTAFSNVTAWTNSLAYTFQVDFGSWDNARYYFNTGGQISITGAYSSPSSPEEVAWATLFTNNFPVNMNWQTTTPQGSNLVVNPAGFYLNSPFPGLTTAYQPIYQKYAAGGGGPYYASNYALIEAKLSSSAGTNGRIDFRITLINGDSFPASKPAGRVTYTINRIQSVGAIPYSGGYTFTSGGFVAA